MGKPLAKKRGGARKPAFMCSAHATPQPMAYDPETAKWVCTDAKCVQFRRPEQAPAAAVGGTMVLRKTPKLILREDEDGDEQMFLWWDDHDIMVPIPYAEAKVFKAGAGGVFLRWHFDAANIERLDQNGNPR